MFKPPAVLPPRQPQGPNKAFSHQLDAPQAPGTGGSGIHSRESRGIKTGWDKKENGFKDSMNCREKRAERKRSGAPPMDWLLPLNMCS